MAVGMCTCMCEHYYAFGVRLWRRMRLIKSERASIRCARYLMALDRYYQTATCPEPRGFISRWVEKPRGGGGVGGKLAKDQAHEGMQPWGRKYRREGLIFVFFEREV